MPLLPTDTVKPRLAEFAAHARSLKGEAQLFLDHFFRAHGHGGVQEAGAILEFRIAKKPGSAQLELLTGQPAAKAATTTKATSKKFADLLWPDRVLVEMKKRGEHLEKHYDQLFDYWHRSSRSARPTRSCATSTSSGSTTLPSSSMTPSTRFRCANSPNAGVRSDSFCPHRAYQSHA